MLHIGKTKLAELAKEANNKKKVRDQKVAGYDAIIDYVGQTYINMVRMCAEYISEASKENRVIDESSPEYKAGLIEGQRIMFRHIEKLTDATHSMVIEKRNVEFEKLCKREEKRRAEWP